MNKRAYERIPASLVVKFFYGNSLCDGIVKNLSENGMCIKTRMCFPFDSRFKLLIPLKDEVMDVTVKVSRIKKTVGFYDTMGVEALTPPKEYLEFVNSLRRMQEFNMVFQISDETLKQTTKCQNNFQCLTAKSKDMCLIDRPVNGRGLYIKERVHKRKNCPYMMSFKYCYICNCPTRYEIYERYNI